eukprot:g11213.t1
MVRIQIFLIQTFLSVALVAGVQAVQSNAVAKPLEIPPLFYSDISNLKLTEYIKSNIVVAAFYHPKITARQKTYLREEFQGKVGKRFNGATENVVVATVNIGARLRKEMGTLYKINKPLSIKIFLPGYSSTAIDLEHGHRSYMLSSMHIIEQVEYIYMERLNVTLPGLQPFINDFMSSVDTDKSRAARLVGSMQERYRDDQRMPKLAFNLYHKAMQKIISGGTGQIAADYQSYDRQLRGNGKGNMDMEAILLVYEKMQVLEHFLKHLVGDTSPSLKHVYSRLASTGHPNPIYRMFVDVHGFPNIYNDIGNIFIDEHIANVTGIYKICKDDEMEAKAGLFEHFSNVESNGMYMSKAKVKDRIKAVRKNVESGEGHGRGNALYKKFDEFGDIYFRCLCIKDWLEDAYAILDAGSPTSLFEEVDPSGQAKTAEGPSYPPSSGRVAPSM